MIHITQSIPWKECSSCSKYLVSITNTTDFAFQEELYNHNRITVKIEELCLGIEKVGKTLNSCLGENISMGHKTIASR